jgi:CRISPR-associated endoribonuclease Cas6
MRLKILFTGKNVNLPINNQSLVNSYFHKLLGNNNPYHDNHSNYIISNIRGGKFNPETGNIVVDKCYIAISSPDGSLLNRIVLATLLDGDFNDELKFSGIDYIEEKIYGGYNHYRTLTPILLKETVDGKTRFITIKDKDFIDKLTERTKKKLLAYKPGINIKGFSIDYKPHPSHKVKRVMIKNIANDSSICQLTITGSKEVNQILYDIGIGQSCGSGFGMLHKTESFNFYK